MNLMVVVLLGVLWASILVPGVLRGRRHRSPTSSIDAFERSMGILANDLARNTSPPARREGLPGRRVLVIDDPARLARRPARIRALRRRRRVLQALTLVTAAAGLAAVALGGWALAPFGVSGTVLFLYVALLARIRMRESEARRTVHPLRPAADLRRQHRGVAARRAVADNLA